MVTGKGDAIGQESNWTQTTEGLSGNCGDFGTRSDEGRGHFRVLNSIMICLPFIEIIQIDCERAGVEAGVHFGGFIAVGM